MKNILKEGQYDCLEQGLLRFELYGKPTLFQRIKIKLWNILLFPVLKITWKEKVGIGFPHDEGIHILKKIK